MRSRSSGGAYGELTIAVVGAEVVELDEDL